MKIGNLIFQDDRTVTPYEERYIEDEVCIVDPADMTMREIKVHEFEYTVSNLSGSPASITKSFATDYGLELSGDHDYKIKITLSNSGIVSLPTSIDCKIRPHGSLFLPTMLTPSVLTYEDIFSSLNGAYNFSIRLDSSHSGSIPHAVKVKVEVIQIVPESRRYLNCVGEYEVVVQPNDVLTLTKNVYSTFGGSVTTHPFDYRVYETVGDVSVPACSAQEIYNEAVIISNHAVAQNYWLLNQQIPINVELLDGYPGGMEFMDEVNITDVATSAVTNFTEFHTPIPPAIVTPQVFAEYDINTAWFHTIQVKYQGSPFTVTRVQLTLRYNYSTGTCECPCLVCRDGDLLHVSWTNDCDETFSTSIEGSLQAGNYKIEGEGFQNSRGDEIYPVVSTQSEYTLAIHRYSDAVFQGLTHLIASNKLVTINGAEYRVKLDGITPKWNEWHTYGNIELTLIKVDSIKTYKRGCNC